MTCQNKNTTKLSAVKLLARDGFDGLQSVMELLVNEAMLLEREKHLGVSAYERSNKRTDYANGFKPIRSTFNFRGDYRGSMGEWYLLLRLGHCYGCFC